MKDFCALSGPWLGWSIQDGRRITEKITLKIERTGAFTGEGTDADGEFELVGLWNERRERLTLTRRYSRTTEPSQEGVGIPYDYEGKWDGGIAFGNWHPRHNPYYGGPFEMWPDQDELHFQNADERELAASR
jgi:hypothetical protein